MHNDLEKFLSNLDFWCYRCKTYDPWIPQLLSRIKKWRWDCLEITCERPSLMVWIPLAYMADPKGSQELCIFKNTTSLDLKKQNRMKDVCQILKILQAGNRLVKLLICATFKEKKIKLQGWTFHLKMVPCI